MTNIFKALQAAAGNAGVSLYVEDVFSTYLYTGNGSTSGPTITTGLDYTGTDYDVMLWTKSRDTISSHWIVDTVRGLNLDIRSDQTAAESNNDAFTGANGSYTIKQTFNQVNQSTKKYVSWTFRKAKKFFDVVTYTGTGSATTVSHNLGAVPACIIVKRTDSAADWQVYHKDNTANPETDYLVLNSTAATTDDNTRWNDTAPTSSVFSVGTDATVNASGGTYVAYLFASDAGGFGDDGSESIIKCGSYTGDGVSGNEITGLGWEPQWLMVKRAGSGGVGGWFMVDTMRGIVTSGAEPYLYADTSSAELGPSAVFDVTPDGFIVTETAAALNASGVEYIYIAIRRPMKTPESASEVFKANSETEVRSNASNWDSLSGFPVDLFLTHSTSTTSNSWLSARLTGGPALQANGTVAEGSTYNVFDVQDGVFMGSSGYLGSSATWADYHFKRAPGFMDVRCYKGDTSSPPLVVSHGLSVTPEIMIIKNRSAAQAWAVYHKDIGATGKLRLNETSGIYTSAGYWNNTAPTASEFTVGTSSNTNGNGNDMLALLFATLSGISKVGSYTGTAASLDLDMGFTNGAAFFLCKRTDSTGDWYLFDSERGIVSGNDPYLLLNSTAAEVTSTDYVDPLAAGLTLTSSGSSTINVSSGEYIYLAIAAE